MTNKMLASMILSTVSIFSHGANLTIDFEDVAVNPSTGYLPVVSAHSRGFVFSENTPASSGYQYISSNPVLACSPVCASNGTQYYNNLFQSNGIDMRAENNAGFSLLSLDFAESISGYAAYLNATSIILTGIYLDGGSVSTVLNLDGIIDGPGGSDDFQSSGSLSGFSNLESVLFTSVGGGGSFTLDNISVSMVPVPAALFLFFPALMALFGIKISRPRP